MKKAKDGQQTLLMTVLVSAISSLLVAGGVLYFSGNFSAQNASEPAVSSSSTAAQIADNSVVDVAASASPSVVSIVITKDVPVIEQFLQEGPFGIRRIQPRISGTETRQIGEGSGFFVSEDGLIATNRHVISEPNASYTALTNGGESYELEIVGRDPFLDVAILKTREEGDFQPLSFGDSDSLRLGERVVAIGNALGQFQNSVSAGVVSGISRSVIAGDGLGEFERLDRVIQTDAAINFGNSGGPLLNLSGEVVGMNVAVAQGSENISFALPGNAVQQVVESVEEYGEIRRPFLGVRYVGVTNEVMDRYNLSLEEGALVTGSPGYPAVVPGSAADAAGLQSGDVITALDGNEITRDNPLQEVIRQFDPGDSVVIRFVRGGEALEARAELKAVPEDIGA